MKNLLINTRCLKTNLTGVQRYTQEFLNNTKLKFKNLQPNRNIPGHIWEQFYLPAASKNNLLFSPANSGPILQQTQIVTIHDLAVIDHPEWFGSRYALWYKFMLPKLINNSLHLITVSNFSKIRIIENYNINPDKISVIPNGVNTIFIENNENSAEISSKVCKKRYFLCHGSIEPRKNLQLLIKAWEKIESKLDNDIYLVISGGIGHNNVFKNLNYEIKSKNIIFIGRVSDIELKSLYKHALSFIYISLYEGFGLPPLEAMASGTRVIVSNTTSLPEVVGNMATQINPRSQSEICQAILDHAMSSNFDQIALNHYARDFQWGKTATLTDSLLSRFL